MNLPKQIKIGGYKYKVVKSKEPIVHNGGECMGLHLPIEQEIKIKVGLSKECEAEVLLHEIMHSLFDQYAIDLFNGATNNMEEVAVSALGRGLMSVFHDNPKFAKYFMEAVR